MVTEEWTPEAIRSLRHDLRLTQAELEELLGAGRQTVGFWETGRHKPMPIYQRALDRLKAEAEAVRTKCAGHVICGGRLIFCGGIRP